MNDKYGSNHAYIPNRQDWLELWDEEILEPDLPIVDPHHHLWDRPGWPYMLSDLLADTNTGHNIIATVFVQCRAFHRADGPEAMRPVGETEFANGVAAMSASGLYGPTKVAHGIVSHADMTLGDGAKAVLEAQIHAGNGRFRGIRHIVASDADQTLMNPAYPSPLGLMNDATFRQGIACLEPLGMSFEGWLYHPQIDEFADLAGAFPNTAMVLNHCGGPLGVGAYQGKTDEVFQAWSASIRELAKRDNVCVKLGGLGMRLNGYDFHEHPAPPTGQALADAWKPYIETCIEAFGPARGMFESNFPVDKGSYGYPAYWNACKILSAGAGADEKRDLFAGTADRFYRLGLDF